MEERRGGRGDEFQQTVGPAVEAAADYAERKKSEGIAEMSNIAAAMHRAADDIEAQLPTAAHYAHEAAASLEKATEALRSQRIEDMARSVGEFARQRPVAFLGGAMLAGFALSRFLKSSADGSGRSTPPSL
jgi:hypothetical protein